MISILVAGPGCMNCTKLAQMCNEIVVDKDIDAVVEKVTDLHQITALGVIMTPGLIINGKVISSGKVPLKSTLESWIMAEVN
ncbi:MAG: thioredoxin family protein [Candidatus Marinimicrobia bacterium]|nr:thioredoxin family protein [Candidatus Neomarinimicrobiota bacterium]